MSKSSHDYSRFANAYSELEIENTYYLAYRDLPALFEKHCSGKVALDYGCGAGKSSRFLKELGFSVTGVDISSDMIKQARQRDPDGSYVEFKNAELPFENSTFDLVFQASVAEEIPSLSLLKSMFSEIARVLKYSGVLVVVTSNGATSSGEWSSFVYTVPETGLRSGGQVELFIREKGITLFDYVWFESDFREVFDHAGLKILERHLPLATGEEPYKWYQELDEPFWDIYVCGRI